MTLYEFTQADPFTRAGFSADIAREMLEIQNKTGLSAQTIIAICTEYKATCLTDRQSRNYMEVVNGRIKTEVPG